MVRIVGNIFLASVVGPTPTDRETHPCFETQVWLAEDVARSWACGEKRES